MGLFSKKTTLTVDELSKAIATLSEEDKKVLYEQAFGSEDDTSEPSESETAEATVEETADDETAVTEATEEVSEGTSDVEAETETEPTVEDSAEQQTTEESKPTAEVEEVEQVTEERHEEVVAALTARIDALEQKWTEFAEIIGDITELRNDDGPLGASAQANVGDSDDELSEDDRIMANYNPNWRRG